MLPFFTILHLLVDACSVTVLVVGGMSWQRVLAYNALAFALQLPLGGMLDVRPRLVKGSFVASLALTLAGVGVCAVGAGDGEDAVVTQIALVLACVGNALFLLSAGKTVLDAHEGRGGPIGLFISTGALGLFAGMKLAGEYGLWCCLGFGAALALAVAVAVGRWRGRAEARPSRDAFLSLSSPVSRLPSPVLTFLSSSSSSPSSPWSRGGAGRG